MIDLSQGQIAFEIGGESHEFEVLRYRGTDGLCRLYRFEIELATRDSIAELESFVGRAAALSINTQEGTRWFHGLVGRIEITGETVGQTYLRVDLMPSLWLLTHRYQSRIFQNKSVPTIIEEVLHDGGIASDQVRLVLTQTYRPREFCVQYRETDFNFICRLMEEEGIWWCFEQDEQRHRLFLADSNGAYRPIAGDAALPYSPPSGMNVPDEHVFRFSLAQAVRPLSVALTDFSFKRPQNDLATTGGSGHEHAHGLHFSDFPGTYKTRDVGDRLAQIRAEEFQAGRTVAGGSSNCHRLAIGRTFELADHPTDVLNGRYLLTSLCYQGKQATRRASSGNNGNGSPQGASTNRSSKRSIRATRSLTNWLYHEGHVSRDVAQIAGATGVDPLRALQPNAMLGSADEAAVVDADDPVYECHFECIPASLEFRPPRVTPTPFVRGTQTARVVGPTDEEIYTDKYGRIKVQFHWDREGRFDERSSCWIRVSQGAAGGQYGMMFLPRVGQEVIVDFLEGDPDKPIIIGRVYNADHMPPYPLPDQKTKSVIKTNSSKGGQGTNEIRFEDLSEQEQILVYAQKDFHLRVNNDRVTNVDHDDHLTVKENRFQLVKKNRHCEVKLDGTETIGGNKTLKVKGDVSEEFGGSHSEKVGRNFFLKVGENVVVEAGECITLKVGKNFIKIDTEEITIKGNLVKVNCSGAKAGKGKLVEAVELESPIDADEVEPGKDTRYNGHGRVAPAGDIDEDIAGLRFRRDKDDRKKSSWIEIELRDELDRPVPGAEYEIIPPDGAKPIHGHLDRNGRAHRYVPEPGMCQITFPKYDRDKWERKP